MPTIDEYVRMAEDAQQDNAHVAVLTYYRTAIEETGYCQNAAPILLAALEYAQQLKKERDRQAIRQWSQGVMQKIAPIEAVQRALLPNGLVERIGQEIEKLQRGNKNATT